MMSIRALITAAALSSSLLTIPAIAAVKIGETAPDLSTPGSDGKPHSLSEYRGQFVVLEWTNDGCPFVRKHYDSGNMQKLQQEAAQAKDTVWLSVISSAPGKQGHVSAAQATALSQSRQASPTQVLLDEQGKLGKAFDAKTTPQLFILDPQGNLIYAGAIDETASADPADVAGAKNYVRAALDEARAGKPVSKPLTTPYGCSIKY